MPGAPTVVPPRLRSYIRSEMATPPAPEPFKVWTNDRGEDGFLHGTKAHLKPGDLIEAGRPSNYGERENATFVYLTATLDAATWGAELAAGDGRGRIYIVEPTGPVEDDPNLTDKKFPGNPTRSLRTREPLRVVGEITAWQGHAPEQVRAMKDGVASALARGIRAIED
jgi:rifampin ADP-ribosylating transferase